VFQVAPVSYYLQNLMKPDVTLKRNILMYLGFDCVYHLEIPVFMCHHWSCALLHRSKWVGIVTLVGMKWTEGYIIVTRIQVPTCMNYRC